MLKKAFQLAICITIGVGLMTMIMGTMASLFICIVDTGFFSITTIITVILMVALAYTLGRFTQM